MAGSIHLCCVANNEEILDRDLRRSPDIAAGRIPVSIIWNAPAAAAAYHDAIDRIRADILVFAHQDVYFPEGWFARLGATCRRLDAMDPCWAVAGLCGMTREAEFVGHLWDSGLGAVCGGPFERPRDIASLDEAVLIVRRASGVSFDPALPSFHLYGTDIVLEAHKAGMKSYAIDLPVIHNSKANVRLDHTYVAAYRFMVRKWKALLPWPTVIVQLRDNPLLLQLRRIRLRYKAIRRASTLHPMLEFPETKARELGFAQADNAWETA